MENKTALITGGTSGIGLSVVEHLAKNQFNVYFIGTNAKKGNTIQEKLSQLTNNKVKFIQLDLSNVNTVYSFTKEFVRNQKQLDLLANIAGVLLPERTQTDEGFEMNFAVAYLSSFVLSVELAPLLKKSANPRIVNVGAKPSIVLKELINFDDIGVHNKYNSFKASSIAVHAKTVLTQILSEKFVKEKIKVNSFDPGMIKSNLLRKMPVLFRCILGVAFAFAPRKSQMAILACTEDSTTHQSGKLFTGKKVYDIGFRESYRVKLQNTTKELLSKVVKLENTH